MARRSLASIIRVFKTSNGVVIAAATAPEMLPKRADSSAGTSLWTSGDVKPPFEVLLLYHRFSISQIGN